MAINGDGSCKSEYKTHFTTREGVYSLMPMIEYYRPSRSNYASSPIPLNAVHLSFVTIPEIRDYPERLCLNIGKELYIYVYKGIRSGADMVSQIEKKSFKAMNPTCHNFNVFHSSSESVPLLLGFNTGIITMQDLIKKDVYKVFNEEVHLFCDVRIGFTLGFPILHYLYDFQKLIDNTKVTCIQWIPNSRHLFLTSHASGQLYLYNEELPCSTSPPNYQLFKSGEDYAIHVCKTKSTRNPLYRWLIGSENTCINQFAFSPCNLYLAVVSQDGFLRVFHYDTMELVGIARSYFGGLLCVCWSHDSKYVAFGGEDDLVTIWSLHEKQIIARGQGHQSWINVVAFDPYTSQIPSANPASNIPNFTTCYRLGSVGQDTLLCLWDLTDDVLRQPVHFNSVNIKVKSIDCSNNGNGEAFNSLPESNHSNLMNCASTSFNKHNNNNSHNINNNSSGSASSSFKDNQSDGLSNASLLPKHSQSSFTQKFVMLSFKEGGNSGKKFSSRLNSSNGADKSCTGNAVVFEDPMRLMGTAACPRFDQCPLLEPLICKKIANERLSALVFKEDCILTSCNDGSVFTWARPEKSTSDVKYYSDGVNVGSVSTSVFSNSNNTVV